MSLRARKIEAQQARRDAVLVKMCGWNEPEKHELAPSNELTELLRRLKGIVKG